MTKFNDHASRLPLVNTFLASKARKYDPKRHKGDTEITECPICFDDFSTSD